MIKSSPLISGWHLGVSGECGTTLFVLVVSQTALMKVTNSWFGSSERSKDEGCDLWLMRVYIIPEKLHKSDPNIPQIWNRCREDKGTFYTVFGNSLMLEREGVCHVIKDMLPIQLYEEAKLFIHGLYPEGQLKA